MLVEFARGKRVVHVGFVDEHRLEAKVGRGTWLHARLAESASALVGLDVEEEGVRWAADHGFEAYAVDAQSPEAVEALGIEPADVVIAGEVVEHLNAPGPFLPLAPAARPPGRPARRHDPNAYRLLNFLAPLGGVELVHPTTRPGTARTPWRPCSPGAGGRSRAPRTTRTRRREWRGSPARWFAAPEPRSSALAASLRTGATGSSSGPRPGREIKPG